MPFKTEVNRFRMKTLFLLIFSRECRGNVSQKRVRPRGRNGEFLIYISLHASGIFELLHSLYPLFVFLLLLFIHHSQFSNVLPFSSFLSSSFSIYLSLSLFLSWKIKSQVSLSISLSFPNSYRDLTFNLYCNFLFNKIKKKNFWYIGC